MGSVMMSGVAPNMTVPVTGIKASDIAVGSTVKLMEGGVATEYLVVNQGKPSGSSLYDDSCDGTWLLRKYVSEKRLWHSSEYNDYENSDIHSYLNGNFFNKFDANTKSVIKQVKIPYRPGYGYDLTVYSGANGLLTKIFLLSTNEVNFASHRDCELAVMGASLSYFSECADGADSKRMVNKLNNENIGWWLRSPKCFNGPGGGNRGMFLVYKDDGRLDNSFVNASEYAVRPAFVLPFNSVFDETTMLLKGVA